MRFYWCNYLETCNLNLLLLLFFFNLDLFSPLTASVLLIQMRLFSVWWWTSVSWRTNHDVFRVVPNIIGSRSGCFTLFGDSVWSWRTWIFHVAFTSGHSGHNTGAWIVWVPTCAVPRSQPLDEHLRFNPEQGVGPTTTWVPSEPLSCTSCAPWSVTCLMSYKLSNPKPSTTRPWTYCPDFFFFFLA